MVGSRIEINGEVANTLELQEIARLLLLEVLLNVTVIAHHERLRIKQFAEVASIGIDTFYAEEAVVETYLSRQSRATVNPVQRLTLDLTVGTRHTATGLRVVGGIDGRDVTLSVLVAGVLLVALDDIGILQTYLLARSQTHKLLLGNLHEVVALNPQLTTEGNGMCALSLVLRIVDSCQFLALVLRIVGDDQLHRVNDCADAGSLLVQVVAHAGLQQGIVVQCVELGVTDRVDEVAVLKEEPNNRNAQMALLAYYNDQKDTLNVNNMIERVLFNKNASTEDRVALMRQVIGESEQHGGDSTRVLQLFHRLLDTPQADSDLALFCASYMNLKKMPNDSIRLVLEKVLEMSPDHAAARLQLVSYAWQAENRDRVIELCRDARQYNPDEMAFYYYQGIAYYQKGQLDEALNAFQNGIGVINSDSDPSIVSDFYAVLGDIMHQKGMEKEAFEAYDSCLVWKDDNIGCLNNYAYYLSEKGIRLDEAERMSFRTIKAEPKNATYLDTYAWILFMQKRYEEARKYIDLTLENDSDTSAVLLEHAGDIYYHAGEKVKAVEFWQNALKLASEESEIKDDRREILIRKIKLKKYVKE